MDWRALAQPHGPARFLLEGRAASEGEGGCGFIDLASDAEAKMSVAKSVYNCIAAMIARVVMVEDGG